MTEGIQSTFTGTEVNAFTTYEIGPDEETLYLLGEGITTAENAPEETLDDTIYYSGDGTATGDVIAVSSAINFSGHRYYGDEAQDYVASLKNKKGQDRIGFMRRTTPDGKTESGPVTIQNIVDNGGDAGAKSTFSFTAKFRTTPVEGTGTPKTSANTDSAGA